MLRGMGTLFLLLGLPVVLFLVARRLEQRRRGGRFAPFLLRRGGWLVMTVLAVFTASFFLMRAVPGGPFDDDRKLLPQVRRNLEARFGLDRPLDRTLHRAAACAQPALVKNCVKERVS